MSAEVRLKTPVVLIVFNRLDTTRRVLQQITSARPETLFVIQDAPRLNHPEDIQGCAAVRDLLSSVDWPCNLVIDASSENLVPKRRISTGLDRVFSQVEEAIILEHDCLPEPTFFRFCEELLVRFRFDQRVMMVGGTNYQFGRHAIPFSYYFSLYPHIWGWATWRRAWQQDDVDMRLWPVVRQRELLKSLLPDTRALRYWTRRFDATYSDHLDTWDYPWTLSCWLQNGLSIVPTVNLVSNIGFGRQALNTSGERSPFSNMPVQPMDFPLVHPPYLIRHAAADRYTQNTVFRNRPLAPLKKRLKQLLLR